MKKNIANYPDKLVSMSSTSIQKKEKKLRLPSVCFICSKKEKNITLKGFPNEQN